MPRAVVVVPCYNEANRLNLPAIQDFGRRSRAAELLFVNDGSRDETRELIEHLHASNPSRFGRLHLAKNGGKAEAVRQGMLLALQSGPDYVGFWDADLATPLAEVERFCHVLDAKPHVEAVIGTRLRLLGHKIERRPLRYWLGRLFANTASWALGVRIFDTQCGAKLFRASRQLEQIFSEPFVARWIFDVEILARMRQARRERGLPPLAESIYELPLDTWREVGGSTLRAGDFLKAIAEMSQICWTYSRFGARHAVGGQTIPLEAFPAVSGQSARGDQQRAA